MSVKGTSEEARKWKKSTAQGGGESIYLISSYLLVILYLSNPNIRVVGANGDCASTPPSKRARFFFRKCFDATFNPRTGVAGANRILAPDSDEEDGGL